MAVAAVSGAVILGQSTAGQDAEAAPPLAVEPIVELPSVMSGPEALEVLGGREGKDLAAVAEAHGWSEAEVAETLENDATLHIDPSGRLFYADTLEGHGAAASNDHDHDHGHGDATQPIPEAEGDPETSGFATSGSAASGASAAGAIAPLEDTFRLHSAPQGAPITLHLDFDGHTFAPGTVWPGLAGQRANAWDPAGDGPAFSDAERIRVQRIWQMVAEHYSFFDVDVTTREPPASLFGGTDKHALRVVISPSLTRTTVNSKLVVGIDPTDTPSAVGGTVGLAYVGTSRTRGYDDSPALVFATPLREGSDAAFASTISHEFGHNFNLRHSFENPPYQQQIAQGSSATAFSALIMDYASSAAAFYFTREERDYVLGGSGQGTSLAYRSLGLIRPADSSGVPVARAGLVTGKWSGSTQSRYFPDGMNRSAVLGTFRCTGSVRVRVEPAAKLNPGFDARIRLFDGDTVVATATETTKAGTATRAAGLGATLDFEADPDVTYTVRMDSDPNGATWAGGSVHPYGQYVAAVSGDGCDLPAVAPSEPVGVTAVATRGSGAVTVAWEAPLQPGSGALTYEVAVDGRRVQQVEAGVTSVRLTDLPEQGTHVRVRAVNATGAGPWVTVRTPYLVAKAPLHVSALKSEDGRSVQFRVVHAPDLIPSDDPDSARFNIMWNGGKSFFATAASAPRMIADAKYFTEDGNRFYTLRGALGDVSVPYVVRDAVTAPSVPQAVRASVVGDEVDVAWDLPLDDGGAFAAYRLSVDDGPWTAVNGFTFAHTLHGLTAGEHTVRVKAIHEGGESAPAAVTFTVGDAGAAAPSPASAPRNVEIVEDASGTRLVWDAPARLYGATVQEWAVTVGNREVTLPAGRRQLSLTGFRAERALAVTVAAVTGDEDATVTGAPARVSLAPAG